MRHAVAFFIRAYASVELYHGSFSPKFNYSGMIILCKCVTLNYLSNKPTNVKRKKTMIQIEFATQNMQNCKLYFAWICEASSE